MKILTSWVAIFLIANAVAFATGRPSAPPGSSAEVAVSDPGGRLLVRTPEIDFGTRFSDELVEAKLVLSNVGVGPLTVTRIVTSCGCAKVSAPAEPIEPGATLELPIRIELKAHKGPFYRRGSVLSDDLTQPMFRYAVKGQVRQRFEPTPKELLLTPSAPGKTATARVTLRRCDGKSMETPSLSVRRAGTTAVVESASTDEATVLVTWPASNVPTTSALEVTVGGRSLFVPLEYKPYSEVRPDPHALRLGAVGADHTSEIRLIPNTRREWSVLEARSRDGMVDVSVTDAGVLIRMRPDAAGLVADEIEIQLRGLEAQERIVVPITAFVR